MFAGTVGLAYPANIQILEHPIRGLHRKPLGHVKFKPDVAEPGSAQNDRRIGPALWQHIEAIALEPVGSRQEFIGNPWLCGLQDGGEALRTVDELG